VWTLAQDIVNSVKIKYSLIEEQRTYGFQKEAAGGNHHEISFPRFWCNQPRPASAGVEAINELGSETHSGNPHPEFSTLFRNSAASSRNGGFSFLQKPLGLD